MVRLSSDKQFKAGSSTWKYLTLRRVHQAGTSLIRKLKVRMLQLIMGGPDFSKHISLSSIYICNE